MREKNATVFWNGLVKENPTFVLMLGMCPTLAVTTSAINGLGMGQVIFFIGQPVKSAIIQKGNTAGPRPSTSTRISPMTATATSGCPCGSPYPATISITSSMATW